MSLLVPATVPRIGSGPTRSYDDWRRLLNGVPLPAAVVDLDAFDHNVAAVAEILRRAGHGHRLRLATKSIRVPELIARVLRFGPPFAGLMCYAAREAQFLAQRGFDDLLIAYPTVQQSDLAALREIHEAGTTVRLVVDSRETIAQVARAFAGTAKPFSLVLDVDLSLRLPAGVHLGVRRSPLRTVGDVVTLVDAASALPAVSVTGLMGYEAQVAGLGDRNPFKRLLNPAFGWVRQRSTAQMRERRAALADLFTKRGWPLEVFNGGGTGSANIAANEPWLTELTVGSGFLCSHLFDYYSNIRFEPAAFFALQATRRSDPGYATCAGGGYIASGEPGWDKVPRPWLPRGLSLVSAEGCGEVQTPIKGAGTDEVKPGDPVLFRHAKAGELAEHFSEYLLVERDQVVGRAATYRGLGQTFL